MADNSLMVKKKRGKSPTVAHKAFIAKGDWISISKHNDVLAIEFVSHHFPGNLLDTRVLLDLDSIDFRGWRWVFLQGRGPLWLYLAVTMKASSAGCGVAIRDLNKGAEGYVVVEPGFNKVSRGTCFVDACVPHILRPATRGSTRVQLSSERRGEMLLIKVERGGKMLSSCVIAMLGKMFRRTSYDTKGVKVIVLDGSMPTWLAAAMAKKSGDWLSDATICITSSSPAGAVVVRPGYRRAEKLGDVLSYKTSGQNSVVYGIIGDPNSGKSVFSIKLYRELQKLCNAFRIDADVCAPTNEWGVSESGKIARNLQKRKWNDRRDVPSLVKRIEENIMISGRDILIVDLPGGIHSKNMKIRIPPLRRPLYKQIDNYIIVQKNDAIEVAWKNEILAVNPYAKFPFVILSRMEMLRPQSGKYAVAPLLRETISSADPGIKRLAKKIRLVAAQKLEGPHEHT